mmetsp:Transcript_23450/g.68515  ORF Transcript_23450/g.68515 Transcript_23450/m.68515 type:complete len:95 (+) Transcript_23450:567-851(+)
MRPPLDFPALPGAKEDHRILSHQCAVHPSSELTTLLSGASRHHCLFCWDDRWLRLNAGEDVSRDALLNTSESGEVTTIRRINSRAQLIRKSKAT